MPKMRRMQGKKVVGKYQRKFRIGNRKTGRAGHELSTDELIGIANGPDQKKAQKARKILQLRGVDLVSPVLATDTEEVA